jgi:hypothetical protein
LTPCPCGPQVKISADNSYDAWIDGGEKVGSGTSWQVVDEYTRTLPAVGGKMVVAIDAKDAELDLSQGVGALLAEVTVGDQVRRTPSWPRSWANFSLFQLSSHWTARAGPTCVFRANPTPCSFQVFGSDDSWKCFSTGAVQGC